VALVVDQASGTRFEAVRGGGASADGHPLRPSGATALGESILGLSGYPPRWFGWKQFRAFGAVALDLCAVAGGRLDGYVDCSPSAHGVWDYLGGLLICQEAGAVVVDAFDRDLVSLDWTARFTPVAAASRELLDACVAARRGFAELHPAWAAEADLAARIVGG
jgi:fructose-1,6-bisphosphatase/inositol monophosphatase family enzyme